MTAGFVLFAPVIDALGFPPIAALLTAIVLVLVPTELGVLWWAARREGVRVADLIPYRRSFPGREWAVLVPGLIVLAFLGFGLLQIIEPALIDRFFGWLPDWYVAPIQVDRIGDYSPRRGSSPSPRTWRSMVFSARSSRSSTSAAISCRGWSDWAAGRRSSTSPSSRCITSGRRGRCWLASSDSARLSTRFAGSETSTSAWSVHCALNTLSVLIVVGLVLSRI